MEFIILVAVMAIAGIILGSWIGVLFKPSEKIIINALAFGAGVMLAVSFLQLLPQSAKYTTVPITVIGFLIGAGAMFLIDRAVPQIHPEHGSFTKNGSVKRTAFIVWLGLSLHNFTEGAAIGVIGAIPDVMTAATVALAIAIHKIPEGICTSSSYLMATGEKVKAFSRAIFTAIPLIIGFIISFFIFQNIPKSIIGFVLAATAGLMIYIVGDELIPASSSKVTGHHTILSVIAGIALVLLLGLIQ